MNEEDIKILEDLLNRLKYNISLGVVNEWNPNETFANALENLINRNKEFKNSLVDMVNQFAYEDNNPKTKGSSLEKLYTGGLSALENAFNTLNIDEGIEREELWKLFQKE